MWGFFLPLILLLERPPLHDFIPPILTLWNRGQGLSTPDIHYDIAHWLEQCWKNDQRYMLLMAFRSCGKSTIVGLFCAWLFFTAPNLRILVLAADLNLARKMVRNVKKIIERHMLTQHLLPEKKEQWASDSFMIKRDLERRDPSMQAKGITANITGSRADIVICDDVEVPKTCDTTEKRQNLRERLLEIEYILVQGGTRLYVGTPHNYYSIYADTPRREIGEDVTFLHDYNRKLCPILDETGASAWPERYSLEEIERMKIHTGPNKFESQMMLKPVALNEGRLNPEDLNIYDDEIDYKEVAGRPQLWLGGRQLTSCSAFWDPAFASAQGRGDSSVLALYILISKAVIMCIEQNISAPLKVIKTMKPLSNAKLSRASQARYCCHQSRLRLTALGGFCPICCVST